MSAPLSESMDQILDRFDDAWNGPTPPSIEEYLRACEPAKRRDLLIELILIDLERRFAAAEPVRVDEMYLRRFPILNDDRAAVVALASREFELRRRREPNLSLTEYLDRWPAYREELAHLLGSHPTLATKNGETRDGKASVDSDQKSEQSRDVVAILTPPPPEAPNELGRLAGYRVLKVLGAGGMGVVFLAEDAQLQRLVALKIMRPGMAANNAARQRFLREARAAAALKHDRIITVYQVGEDCGVPFLAMEYLQGESLHDRLNREPKLPLAEVLRLGSAIADGLAAAHARGLIHRDIKPANIWLEQSEPLSEPRLSEPRPLGSGADNRSLTVAAQKASQTRVKLLDFGLARPIGGGDAQLTQTGVIVGTPAFMSPEQARGEKVDARSDLFSLGCILYRMTTGQLPFQGRDIASTLLSLAHDHPQPPRELNPNVPPTLNLLIQRLLAKNAADRPISAESVVKPLQTLPTEPEPAPVPPPLPQPVSPPPRRLVPAALIALALLGMTVMLGGIVIRIRNKDGHETTIKVSKGSTVTIEPDDKDKGAVPPLANGTEALGSFALVQRPARLKGVRSWTIETRILRGGSITCAMRPDGRQLAVGGFDGVIRLYDPNTGRLQQSLFGQQKDGSYFSLSWSPDGKRLASRYGGHNDILQIWDAATGQILRTIHTPGFYTGPVAWPPDGNKLAVGSNDGVTLWDAKTGQQIPFAVQARNISSLAWSPDSTMLAAGSSSPQVVWLW